MLALTFTVLRTVCGRQGLDGQTFCSSELEKNHKFKYVTMIKMYPRQLQLSMSSNNAKLKVTVEDVTIINVYSLDMTLTFTEITE